MEERFKDENLLLSRIGRNHRGLGYDTQEGGEGIMYRKVVRRVMWVGVAAGLVLLSGCTWLQSTEAVLALSGTGGTVPWTVTFDASTSSGPDGISTTRWEFGNGDETYDGTGAYTYEHAGTFEIELTVRAHDGSTDVAIATVVVEPAFWVADENLDTVYRLSLNGAVLDTYSLPVTQPRGLAIAEVADRTWLYVACANDGVQKILRLDPATGIVDETYSAPAQAPLQLTFDSADQIQFWHVDGLARKIYRLNPSDLQFRESYGQSYFKATSPEVANVSFLRTPEGLDWTSEEDGGESLWYLEGDTGLLYRIEITPGYDIMSNTQLQISGDPVEIDASVRPAAGVDFYDGMLWLVDVDRHRIIEIDPETGEPTGREITGFPGSRAAGLEIQS